MTAIQVYPPTMHVKEAKVDQFYKDLEDLLEITPSVGIGMKRVGSQEIPGINRQLWPWKTK